MEHLWPYWAPAELLSNGLIILNIFGAMLLGLALGYERNFHGHAAGMRTYALVCMSAAAITAICGYPVEWYGAKSGMSGSSIVPTQVIQGIVTGIGFLGAGVIMKEGFTIRGLSTAASIWAASAIGVIIGVGFYATAIVTTLLVLVVMGSFKKLELKLPHRRQVRATLVYRQDLAGPAADLPILMRQHGYMILEMACHNDRQAQHFEYDLVLQGEGSHNFDHLIDVLRAMTSLAEFRLSPVRD